MKNTKTSLDRRMVVDKNIVDELLLVCGVIGTTTNAGNELVPVTDCLNWLQDLQRALRRDEDLYRPISLLIGKWKVVEQKLLPLVMTCRYDTPIVLTVVKILVILTKPLAENTKRAGQLVIDKASAKKKGADHELLVAQQQKIRDNALEQAQQLMEYKRLMAFHPSHHRKVGGKDSDKKEKGTGLLSIFVSLLAEPLSKSGASRTDADHLTIELVLHLIRNLLSAEPLLNTSATTSQQAAQLHQEMISLFERELVFDILLVVGQEMELRENSQYNLLMMEILHHILKHQDPMAVAKSKNKTNEKSKTSSAMEMDNRSSFSSSSTLMSRLKDEKAQRRNLAAVRHGHFGGTWMQKQSDGKRQFLSASAVVEQRGFEANAKHLVQARRKNRMAEPFIGSGKTLLAHTRLPLADSGPATHRANQTLFGFCERFMADCYGPFMKSLKNEFRRDSVRLEESDKVVFFRLVWFFVQWWRSSYHSRSSSTVGAKEVVGRLIITMDVFTFKLVTSSMDTFHSHKKHSRLAQTVALYSEMMHLLHDMYTSKDNTEHQMAMGLIDRIFYGRQESFDPLPKMLSQWTPGTFTRGYLCDLMEVVHLSLKLLEANTKKGIEFVQQNTSDGRKQVSQKIAKMRKVAAEFDIKGYLVRKVVSNQTITMYGHLLAHYRVNSSVVNHRIIAMFLRLMRVEIASPDAGDAETPMNPLGMKRVTLEPMLYNLQLIMALEQILNDSTIRKEKDFEPLLRVCTSLMHKFWVASDANPMLYVECLFRHTTPHRFCELATNMYVSDELRMVAEKEMLLLEASSDVDQEDPGSRNIGNKRNTDEDDDEEELEFNGDVVQAGGTDEGKESLPTEKDEDVGSNEDEETNEAQSQSDGDEAPLEDGQEFSNRNDKRPREEQTNCTTTTISPSKKVCSDALAAKPASSDDDDVDFGIAQNDNPGLSVFDDTDEEQ
ncbi:MAG: hypothetical protein SGILL_003737 [Bacillariaceae sp.]